MAKEPQEKEPGNKVASLGTTVCIFGGNKGGVGKSTSSRAFVDMCLTAGVPVAVLDADTENPDVHRMFKDATPSLEVNLKREDGSGWMDAMDFIAEHPGRVIVMSTPAGIGDSMNKEFKEFCDFLSSVTPKPKLLLFWVMGPSVDSINLLAHAIPHIGGLVDQIIPVRHHGAAGDPSQFGIWNDSSLCKDLTRKGWPTRDMPALHVRVFSRLQELEGKGDCVPYRDAMMNAAAIGLSASERSKLASYQGSVLAEFGPLVGIGG